MISNCTRLILIIIVLLFGIIGPGTYIYESLAGLLISEKLMFSWVILNMLLILPFIYFINSIRNTSRIILEPNQEETICCIDCCGYCYVRPTYNSLISCSNYWDNIICSTRWTRANSISLLLGYIIKHIIGWVIMCTYLPSVHFSTSSVIGYTTLAEIIGMGLCIEPLCLINVDNIQQELNKLNVFCCCHTRAHTINPEKINMGWTILSFIIFAILNVLHIAMFMTIEPSEYSKSYVHYALVEEVWLGLGLLFVFSCMNKWSRKFITLYYWGIYFLVYSCVFIVSNFFNAMTSSATKSLFTGVFRGEPFNCNDYPTTLACIVAHIDAGTITFTISLGFLLVIAILIIWGLIWLLGAICYYDKATGRVNFPCFRSNNNPEYTHGSIRQVKIITKINPYAQIDTEITKQKFMSDECVVCKEPRNELEYPTANPCAHQVVCSKCIINNHNKLSNCYVCRSNITHFVLDT